MRELIVDSSTASLREGSEMERAGLLLSILGAGPLIAAGVGVTLVVMTSIERAPPIERLGVAVTDLRMDFGRRGGR